MLTMNIRGKATERPYRFSRFCCVAVAVLAALALWSWGAGVGQLFAFTPSYVPMAPATALCLGLLSAALYLRTRPAGRFTGLGLATMAGFAGLLAGVRPWLGWGSPLEEWLAQSSDRIGDIPVGQMSPFTGDLLLVLAIAYCLQAFAAKPRSIGRRLAGLLAGAVLLTSAGVIASYAAGKPWFYGRPVIPIALWTAITFAFLGLAILSGLWAEATDSPANPSAKPDPSHSPALDGFNVGITAALLLVIGTVTASYLRQEQAKDRAYAGEILHAIGDLKMAQVAQWRNERMADATYLHRTPYVARRALDVLVPSPSARTRQMFTSWLDSLFQGGPVDKVFLLDGDLKVRLVHPQDTGAELSEAARQAAEQALNSREVVVADLHRSTENGPAYLTMMVPFIVRREGTNDNVPAAGTGSLPTDRGTAVLGLQINAHRSLFPILQSWPTPSRTAETVLVARHGDEVVFLNELRHRTNSALRVRFPLNVTNYLPAARALLGQTGLMEGRDYRDVPVLADVRPVPGTKWFLIAKVDRDEIYAPLRQRAWLTLGLTVMLILAAVLLAGFVTKRRETVQVQRELASEHERLQLAQRVEHLMKHANDAILVADEHDRVVEANERMASRYGYSLAELPGMHLSQFRAPSVRPGFAGESARVFTEGKAVFETIHQRKDGSVFPVEISSNVIEVDGRRFKLGILRDITERKAHEREIERLTRLYSTLSQINQSIVRTGSRQQLFQSVCRIAVKYGGFKLAWIGWPEGETRRVRAVAYAGDAEGYLEETMGRTDNGTEGSGPVAACLREGRACVFNDFISDERAKSCRDSATKHGLFAVAAFPIRFNGEVCAAFTVYAGEPQVFQDKEVALLEETAFDISFALENLAREEQRRAAEEAVRASAGALLAAQRVARLGNWESDSPTGRVVWSPEIYRIYGRDPELGPADAQTLSQFFTPESWLRLRAAKAEALAKGTPYACDAEVILPDGSHRWVTSRGEAVRDASGVICGLRGTTQDITERKLAEVIREAFQSLATKLSANRSAKEAARTIFETADRFWKWDAGVLDLCLPGSELVESVLRFDLVDGQRSELPSNGGPEQFSPRIRRVLAQGAELVLRRPPFPEVSDSLPFGNVHRLSASIMCAPIRWLDQPMGVIAIHSYSVNAFTEEDLRTLQALADHCAGALERIRAGQALGESERRLRLFIEHAPASLAMFDEEMRYLAVSRRWLSDYNLGGQDVLGQSHYKVFPETSDSWKAVHRRGLAGEVIRAEEDRFERADGTGMWLRWEVRPWNTSAGQVGGIVIFSEDITERKFSEARLRESEALYHSLVEHVPQHVFRKDLAGRFTFGNATFCRSLGRPLAEILGKTDDDFFPAPLAAKYRADDQRVLQTGETFEGEEAHQGADGSTTFVNVIKTPLRDAIGRITGLQGIAWDITERKRLEVALRHQELLAREAGEIAHLGGWEFDPATGLGSWSEETARIHDLEITSPISIADGFKYYEGESRSRIEAAVKDAVERGVPYDLELEMTSAKGRRKWVRTICRPVLQDGRVARVRGSFQDITERKRTEQREQLRVRCLQLLGMGAPLPEVLDAIVNLLECGHDDWRCAIMLVDDAGRRLVHGAAPRLPEFYQQAVNGLEVGDGVGSCGTAAATGKLVVVEDVAVHPYWEGYRDLARRAGIRACWSQPILSPDEEILGTFAIYHAEPRVPTWEEVHALAGVSGLASLAIERRRAETALRASEERFRSLYENSTVGIYRTTPDGRILLANPTMVKLLGYDSFAELADRKLDQGGFEPGYAREQFVQTIERDGEIRGLEAAWKRRDGATVFVRETARAVRDATGRTLYYDGVIEDVTQRKQAEEQLRKLSRAVECSPVSIVITDRDGRIEYVNPKFTEVTGYSFAEALGQNPRLLKSGETLAENYANLWATISQGREWRGEFHNKKKNGELFWEAASISPIHDETGNIRHFVAVKEDITERKRLEAQVRQAQKMEAVGQLAGGVAHDFNNILAAIMLHLGLLRGTPDLDPFLASSLKELEAEAKRAAGLTRQLLQFSRRSVMQLQPLDVNEVVENLLKMLRRLIGEQINLEWQGASHLPAISADVGMVEQIILNLVVNARDAMRQGGRIIIATQLVELNDTQALANPDARPGRFVCLSVADSGSGMEETVLKRIFEPFFTTKEAGKGTGLGLATVYGIARQHQGWVAVESEVGRGSTFRVYFAALERAAASAATDPAPPPPAGGQETILLVEDESSVRKTVGNYLRRCGYHVLETASGPEALSFWALHWKQIDLLFTDMVMPGGFNGLQLTEKLRVSKPDLKVIISSGYSADLVQQCDLAGLGITFLPKPSLPDELAAAVRRCLDS